MITSADTADPLDVSRETLAKLERYAASLVDWQTRMNLVGPSTIPDLWQRHFADSLQLPPLVPHARRWLDIGAGAGFPGLVIAIAQPDAHVTLVESITKKCRFLEHIISELEIGNCIVENRRVEALPPQNFDIITARALAPLHQLFAWGIAHAGPMTRWVFPKGARVDEEIAAAAERFRFQHSLVQSCTDSTGRIVVARQVSRR